MKLRRRAKIKTRPRRRRRLSRLLLVGAPPRLALLPLRSLPSRLACPVRSHLTRAPQQQLITSRWGSRALPTLRDISEGSPVAPVTEASLRRPYSQVQTLRTLPRHLGLPRQFPRSRDLSNNSPRLSTIHLGSTVSGKHNLPLALRHYQQDRQ
jgi:hypothetical protein